jgi:transaldolase
MRMECQFQGSIKIYSDGADRKSMLEMAKNPLVKGLTTNPSLMKLAGVQDYRSYCKGILSEITDKPISFEVFADDFAEMEKQAQEINSWGANVYVKIPITNSLGASSIPLIESLTRKGVKLNVTALFTLDQVEATCRAVKGGAPTVVSVFAGRIADSGYDPIPLMVEGSKVCASVGPEVELLWASTREVFNIIQAELAGCQIITVPPEMIKKVSGFRKDLLQASLDTVKAFKKDSEAAGFKL